MNLYFIRDQFPMRLNLLLTTWISSRWHVLKTLSLKWHNSASSGSLRLSYVSASLTMPCCKWLVDSKCITVPIGGLWFLLQGSWMRSHPRPPALESVSSTASSSVTLSSLYRYKRWCEAGAILNSFSFHTATRYCFKKFLVTSKACLCRTSVKFEPLIL